MSIRVGVFGAAGRMGVTVCRAVLDAPDIEKVLDADTNGDVVEIVFRANLLQPARPAKVSSMRSASSRSCTALLPVAGLPLPMRLTRRKS